MCYCTVRAVHAVLSLYVLYVRCCTCGVVCVVYVLMYIPMTVVGVLLLRLLVSSVIYTLSRPRSSTLALCLSPSVPLYVCFCIVSVSVSLALFFFVTYLCVFHCIFLFNSLFLLFLSLVCDFFFVSVMPVSASSSWPPLFLLCYSPSSVLPLWALRVYPALVRCTC